MLPIPDFTIPELKPIPEINPSEWRTAKLTEKETLAVDTFFRPQKKRLHSCPECKKEHLRMIVNFIKEAGNQ